MSDAWAVLLGAGVTLLGTALVPWIRELVTERSRTASSLRDSRKQAVADYLAALNDSRLKTGMAGASAKLGDARLAQARLSMLFDQGSTGLADIVRYAANLSQMEEGRSAFNAVSDTLTGWYRGDISPGNAKDYYRDAFSEYEKNRLLID